MEDDRRPDRQHPRINTTATVDYSGSDILLFHKIENISLGGICIQAAGIEPIGTVVELSIHFSELKETIEVTAEVVWTNHEPPKDMGLRFLQMTREARNALTRYLQK